MEKERIPKRERLPDEMGRDFKDDGITVLRMPTEPKSRALDLSGFEAEPSKMTVLIKRRLVDFAGLSEKFLSGSVITDSFTDHTHRRHWRHEMHKKYGHAFNEVADRNILRMNNLAGIYSWMDMLVSSLDTFKVRSEKADRLRDLARTMPDISDYDSHSTDEKMEIAREYERICTSYLALLSPKATR